MYHVDRKRVTPTVKQDKMNAQIKNDDDLRLMQMGHKPELRRQYSLLSVASLSIVACNSWSAVGGTLIAGIGAGGPAAVLYGWILVSIFALFMALSIAELASAFPTAGGAYHWASAVAPKKHSAVLSFATGWLNLFAWITMTSSSLIFMGQCTLAIANLVNPDVVIEVRAPDPFFTTPPFLLTHC